MPISVLLVDDSAVIRGLMSKALAQDAGIAIAGTAANGQIAISVAAACKPDIIILDIEMPIMDGLAALPELLKVSPASKIIMASALTVRNAEISLKAMSLGATDYIGKPSAKFGQEVDAFYRDIIAKVRALGGAKAHIPSTAVAAPVIKKSAPPVLLTGPALYPGQIKAIAIASSTGGPQALMNLFGQIKGRLRNMPIFITQHMPPSFTTILADHLSKAGERKCVEAKGGEIVQPGEVYVAPGDYHMVPEKEGVNVVVRINQNPPENFCRPAADPMLRELSKIYGDHLMVVVLTGMGQDGMEGAKVAVAAGGYVIAQDEASCVVYGMPKAVADAKLCRAVLPLPEIGSYILQQIEGRA